MPGSSERGYTRTARSIARSQAVASPSATVVARARSVSTSAWDTAPEYGPGRARRPPTPPLNGGHGVALPRPAPVLRRVRREPLQELRTQVLRLDHGVHHQLRGEVQNVYLLLVMRAKLLRPPLPLLRVLDRLELVVEDGVDRRLGSHHRDLRPRQRDARVRVVGRAGHREQPRPVGLADNHRNLRNGASATAEII